MKFKDYLKAKKPNDDITLIVAKAIKDENTPRYHEAYLKTPIFTAREWGENERACERIILNDKAHSIDWLSGANWERKINGGFLSCLLVISEEDFAKLLPSKEQRENIVKYIESKMEVTP